MNWKTLVKIGLIGTDRSKISEEMLHKLEEMGIKDEDPARLILKAASTLSMMRKAGVQPKNFEGDLPLATEKHQTTICSKRAIQYLNMILKRNDLPILIEFLAILKKYNKSLPPESLPLILNKAVKTPSIWEALNPVIGDRGRWLMAQNPNWSILNYIPTLDDWENGDTAKRAAYLRYQRSINPTHALSILEETWPQENTIVRKKLLDVLAIGLSKTDDIFLSARLEDKQKNIREKAANLLSKIPASSYNQRMLARLKKLVKVKNINKKSVLEIKIPKGVDDTMIKDGIKASLQLYRSGNKASQLAQMIHKLPLDYWNDLTGLSPSELLPLFIENEYAYLLLNSVSDAAAHHNDEEWSKLILEKWLTKKEDKLWQNFAPLQLISVLNQDAYDQLTVTGFKNIKFLPAENTPLDFLLQQGKHEWKEALSLSFFDRLKSWLNSSEATHWGDWHIRKILSIAGLRVPSYLYPKISKGWPEHLPVWSGWERDISGSLTSLELRYKIEKALKENQ